KSDCSGGTHEGDGCGPGVFEGYDFIGIGLGQQGTQQLVVEGMTGLEAAELAYQALAQQVEVTDGIEDLVLDEFVLVTQAVFVQYAILVHHNGIVHTATQSQVLRAQVFDIPHEAEGTRTADFLDEGSTGEVDTGGLASAAEYRMVEVDAEGHLEALDGHEGCRLAVLFHGHSTLDATELHVRVLFLGSRWLGQEHERTGAAFCGRYFRRTELHHGVVDTQAGHGRQQVLDGIHLDSILDQRGRHGGLADVLGPRRNLGHGVEISATEHDAAVHRRRFQSEVDLLTRVQANTGGPDGVLQCALSDHA